MNFDDAVVSFFKKCFVLHGRASRAEHNYIILFMTICSLFLFFGFMFSSVVNDIGVYFGIALLVINILISIVMVIPYISLTVRRIHDFNLSGWWVLVVYITKVIPLLLPDDLPVLSLIIVCINILISVAFAILLIFIRGTVGPNRFGPDPLATGEPEQAPVPASE